MEPKELKWFDLQEEDYHSTEDFLNAVGKKSKDYLVYPLPNRFLEVIYEDEIFWIRPLQLNGRTVTGRIQTMHRKVPIGAVVKVDITDIMNITAKTKSQTERIISDILWGRSSGKRK